MSSIAKRMKAIEEQLKAALKLPLDFNRLNASQYHRVAELLADNPDDIDRIEELIRLLYLCRTDIPAPPKPDAEQDEEPEAGARQERERPRLVEGA